MKILIIGGGISGLTTAYLLHKKGIDVTVLEKDLRPGGSIRTERKDGYLIECGPNSTLDNYQEAEDLCHKTGIIDQKIFADRTNKNRYVVRNGGLRKLPTGLMQFLTTDLWSIRGKLRLMGEPFIPKYRSNREETIAQFVTRRTGREFLDYGIDPFVTGVFAGDPSRLSLRSCFPKMYALEQNYGGLVKGAILGRKKKGEPKRRMRLFSFRDGLQVLPDILSREIGDRFMGGVNVTSVKSGPEGYEVVAGKDGEERLFKADKVVLAIPAWSAAKIIHPLSDQMASDLAQIEYVPVVIVFTGFDRSHVVHPLDGFGFLIPSKESSQNGFNVLGSIWSSTIFPGRAPEGKAAFTNILGGARKKDVLEYSDSELLEMTLQDLKKVLHIDRTPEFIQIIRQARAIPQYILGHQDRISSVEKELAGLPGLHLAGNFINGVSVGHCIAEATKLVDRIT